MTEEREHNPAPARKKPRFCEGRVLSALTVIAVRPPQPYDQIAPCPRDFLLLVGWTAGFFSSTHSVVVLFHVRYLPRAGGAAARPAGRILPGLKTSSGSAGSVSSGTRRWFYPNARRDHGGERRRGVHPLAILWGVLPHRRPAFSHRHRLAALDLSRALVFAREAMATSSPEARCAASQLARRTSHARQSKHKQLPGGYNYLTAKYYYEIWV